MSTECQKHGSHLELLQSEYNIKYVVVQRLQGIFPLLNLTVWCTHNWLIVIYNFDFINIAKYHSAILRSKNRKYPVVKYFVTQCVFMFHLVSKPLHGMDHNMWNGSGVLSRLNVRHRRSTRASDPKTNIYLYFFAVSKIFRE